MVGLFTSRSETVNPPAAVILHEPEDEAVVAPRRSLPGNDVVALPKRTSAMFAAADAVTSSVPWNPDQSPSGYISLLALVKYMRHAEPLAPVTAPSR